MNELSQFLVKETPLPVHSVSFSYSLENFTLTILSLSCITNPLSIELLHDHIVISLNKANQNASTFPSSFPHYSPFIYSKASRSFWLCALTPNSSFHFGTECATMRFLNPALLKECLWRSPMISKLLNPMTFLSPHFTWVIYRIWNSWLLPHPLFATDLSGCCFGGSFAGGYSV